MQEATPTTSFWYELKRRHVVKVAVAYAVVGIAVGEGAEMFLPSTGAPAWVSPVVLVLIVLGFPVALVLARLPASGPVEHLRAESRIGLGDDQPEREVTRVISKRGSPGVGSGLLR